MTPGSGAAAPEPVLVVMGLTASGKSALALALAEAFEGVVINMDSMQVDTRGGRHRIHRI